MATPSGELDSAQSSLDTKGALPSFSRIVLFGLIVPAAAAFSNQWLFEHSNASSWPLSPYGMRSWPHLLVYPWMALSAAAISWCAGRYLYPALLRCTVFVWCLVLLDLLTFLAAMARSDSHFGYMLVSAEINLVILWTILGPGGWQWRLPTMLAVTPLVIIFGTSIGSTWWYSQSWQLVVLLAALMATIVCAALRWLGFKLQPARLNQNIDSQRLGISQFGVKHMLFWSAAIVPLLLIARSLDFLFITRIRQNELFPLALISVSLATVNLIAVWIVLGAGSWLLRVALLIVAPLLITAGLEVYSSFIVSQFGPYSSYRRPMRDLYIEMSGNWFAWIWQGTALLAALLLFLRASGYRFVRSAQGVAPHA
ncbi:MAG TPA: hypothetical protein VH107_20870 [Lacipirellulaceae bacterium]|jgi:hypothetical protein|nr:hypothetical protein [Lacipirellulaceae bacterium]